MSKTKPQTVKVTLATPHKHRGIWYPEGAQLEVRTDQAARMYRQSELTEQPDVPDLRSQSKAQG